MGLWFFDPMLISLDVEVAACQLISVSKIGGRNRLRASLATLVRCVHDVVHENLKNVQCSECRHLAHFTKKTTYAITLPLGGDLNQFFVCQKCCEPKFCYLSTKRSILG
jgi:hypothetical protein